MALAVEKPREPPLATSIVPSWNSPHLAESALAPVVIGHEHTVLHCSDPSMLGAVLMRIEMMTSSSSAAMTTAQALSSNEAMMTVGRRFNFATVCAPTSHLSRAGFSGLAKRVRAAARACGTHARPDNDLPAEVEAALDHGHGPDHPPDLRDEVLLGPSLPATPTWSPASLMDDRVVRRSRRIASPPTATVSDA